MKIVTLVAAMGALAAPAFAQQAPATPAPLQVEIPELPTATADSTCGGNPALAQQAFCVSTTQAAIEALVDAYSAAFSQQGWLPAGGGDNLVVYVKRRPAGGCDGFQMLAFADNTRQPAPGAPAWLAFATVPGDVCAAQAPAPAAPGQ
jgi:hypothetical protein